MTVPSKTSAPIPLTIAVTSGKGGVGKTSVVINLAVALARLHRRVMVVDADFGLGSVDVLLGLTPSCHVGHVLAGEKTLAETIVEGPGGIRIVPASSGIRQLTQLSRQQRESLLGELRIAAQGSDVLLIDTAPGISDNVLGLVEEADLALVVATSEPAAIVDAYAMVKLLALHESRMEIGLVVNGADDEQEAHLVHTQLDAASKRFLQRSLPCVGHVVRDDAFRDAVLAQRAVVEYAPEAVSSRAYRRLAARIADMAPRRDRKATPPSSLRLVPSLAGASS